jgi:twitching motility two-component system response regulator PilH
MSRKILLVDDSASQLEEMKKAVAPLDAHIITATSGREAVDKARAERPDIIFMDIVMQDLDGFGACREIKANAETSNIPVVFVSTKNNRADKLWADKQGADDFITKPYEPRELIEQVTRLA